MQIITTTSDLTALVLRLEKHPHVTIDTEFLRESTFWPILCLIQIASEDESAIIDPMADGINLKPLFELMQNEDILKIFHAGRQDLEIFFHLNGKVPTPIFDTQVAAMVCGFGESVGYDTLVSKIVGKSIDKSSRFTDWSRRPLSEKQLTYAEADVTHLRDVYKFLAAKLAETSRTEWVKSEMEILRSAETYFTPPENAWKRIKSRNTHPKFLGILQAIAGWREEQAHKQNIPRSRVLKDESLLEIASNPPSSLEKLSHVRGIGQRFSNGNMGNGLLEAVKKGANLPADQCPIVKKKEMAPKGTGPLMDLLRVVLKQCCEENDVAQKLICNAADLEKIAIDDDADVPALKGWRREIFGDLALQLKKGKIALASESGKIKIIRLE